MFFCYLGYVNADFIPTISSTTNGGNWNNASTWEEGRVPTDSDIVEIKGNVKFYGNIELTGDLEITESGSLSKGSASSSYYTFTLNGDLLNKGLLGGNSSHTYYRYVNFNVKGDVLNEGTISYLNNFYLYGSLDNSGTWFGNTYLKWGSIDGYSNYILSITGEDDINITNTTQYLLPTYIRDGLIGVYWRVKGDGVLFDSDWTSSKCINVYGCINMTNDLLEPIQLKQKVESPFIDKREIEIGEEIGKYQSGSGIILSAEIINNTEEQRRLVFEIYKAGNSNPIDYVYSDYIISGVEEVTVPYPGKGDFYWRVRIENANYEHSDWKEFGGNIAGDTDYALFEGFEPYPYGYNFHNRSVDSDILTGGIEYIYDMDGNPIGRTKVPGLRWEIFEQAFDLSIFEDNEDALLNAFENTGLNKQNLLQGGSCYGMSISSVMQEKKSDYMANYYPNFYNKVGSGTVWSKLDSPSTVNDGSWDVSNETLRAIMASQISQYSGYHQDLFSSGAMTPEQILNTLNTSPDNTYLLLFDGKDENLKNVGHAVVPYRIEGNRIYVWDNNNPYVDDDFINGFFSPYEQYIELIIENGVITGFKNDSYNWEFNEIALVNIGDIYNGGEKVKPIGFNENELVYTVSGNSDIYVVDEKGRISGFQDGKIIEEIPGVRVIKPLNNQEENTWKQIYLPKEKDLIVKVKGKKKEKYNLMIAGGDYYTKLDDVETVEGEIDSFVSKRESFEIDFDDNKKGDYILSIDDMSKNKLGKVNISKIQANGKKHKYNLDWKGFKKYKEKSVMLEIDNDNNGDYEVKEYLIQDDTKLKLYKLKNEIPGFFDDIKYKKTDKINPK